MRNFANRVAFWFSPFLWIPSISCDAYTFSLCPWIGEFKMDTVAEDSTGRTQPHFQQGDQVIVIAKSNDGDCDVFGIDGFSTRCTVRCSVPESSLIPVGLIRRGTEYPPEIGTRDFYYVHARVRFQYGSRKKGEEEQYDRGWLLDWTQAQDGKISLIGIEGKPMPFTLDQWDKNSEFIHRVTLRWDTRNDLPPPRTIPKDHPVAVACGEISAFFNGPGGFLSYVVVWILASFYTRISTHHRRDYQLPFWGFVVCSVVLFFVTALVVGNVGEEYRFYKDKLKWFCEDRYDMFNSYVEHRKLDGGRFLPMISDSIDTVANQFPPKWEVSKGFGLLTYCVIFPLWFFWHLPGFIRGIHYFAIPHPVEKHIPTVGRDGVPERIDVPSLLADISTPDLSDLPPTWVSSNQKKRLDAAKEVVKAQNELMQEVIRHTKSREYIDDQR